MSWQSGNPAERETHGIIGRASKARVFSNEQCAHVWAAQSQDDGRTGNGSMYFRDRTIYSYRNDWPLATFVRPGLVVVNEETVSPTTGGHLRDVRGALDGLDVKIVSTDCPGLRRFVRGDETAAQQLIDGLLASAITLADPRKHFHIRGGRGTYDRAVDAQDGGERCDYLDRQAVEIAGIAELFGLNAPVDLKPAKAVIRTAFAEFFAPEAVAKRQAAAVKRLGKAVFTNMDKALDRTGWDASRKIEAAFAMLISAVPEAEWRPYADRISQRAAHEAIDAEFNRRHPDASSLVWNRQHGRSRTPISADDWRAGKPGFYDGSTTLLRRKGGVVETSRGAEVPFAAGVRTYQLAVRGMARGTRCGAFMVDRLDANGDMKIGCHYIDFAEATALMVREAPQVLTPRYPLPALV